MSYKVSAVEVWAGDIMNKPGMLARVLESVSNSGGNLEFMIARKVTDETSRVFLSPMKGKKVKKAAQDVGLVPAQGLFGLRVEGPDRPGLASDLARAVAGQGINLRGASAAAIGKKTAVYLAFESEADLKNAMKVAKSAVKKSKKSNKGKK